MVFSVIVPLSSSTAIAQTPGFLTTWGSCGNAPGEFNTPALVTVSPNGNLYVTDIRNYRVQIFTNGGLYLGAFGTQGDGHGEFSSIFGITADSNNFIYVSDVSNGSIQKFNPNGAFVLSWGAPGTDDGHLNVPLGIAADSDNNIWVLDNRNRVQVFTNSGSFLRKMILPSVGQLSFLVFDAFGNFYVVDDASFVDKYTRDGQFVLKWGGQGNNDGQFRGIGGIAVNSNGDVYVTDFQLSQAEKFSGDGVSLLKWGKPGSEINQFMVPEGIAFDNNGNFIYIVDTENCRVQEFVDEFVPISIQSMSWGNIKALYR